MDGHFPVGLQAALEGRYELLEEIGRGLMAGVYRAREVKHDRPVAIKVLNADLATSLGAERFLREIEIAARLQHPNILPLLDSGVADSVLYFVMPYVEGKSLYERMESSVPLSAPEAVRLAREVASALKHAHDAGVAHLDVKPANILLSNGHAMLADFGIAGAICDSCNRSTETMHAVAGTPGYMSPEQALGGAVPNGRSDVYSLACVLFEMLTGALPFPGWSLQEVVSRQLNPQTRPLSVSTPRISPSLEKLIIQALALDPADRPQSIDQFLQVLSTTPLNGRETRQKTPWLTRRMPRKRDLVRLGAASAAVAVLTAMGFMAASEGPSGVERPEVTVAHPDAKTQADSAATDAATASATLC